MYEKRAFQIITDSIYNAPLLTNQGPDMIVYMIYFVLISLFAVAVEDLS